MIIQLDSATADHADAAMRNLGVLTRSWGYEISQAPSAAMPAAGMDDRGDGKGIDPVALASLVLSLPSAALAVADLADRIRKRHRAAELIGHAQELATQRVTVYLISAGRTVELRTLTPDQLLDLADEDPAD
jgi:hypothetical protein